MLATENIRNITEGIKSQICKVSSKQKQGRQKTDTKAKALRLKIT